LAAAAQFFVFSDSSEFLITLSIVFITVCADGDTVAGMREEQVDAGAFLVAGLGIGRERKVLHVLLLADGSFFTPL